MTFIEYFRLTKFIAQVDEFENTVTRLTINLHSKFDIKPIIIISIKIVTGIYKQD